MPPNGGFSAAASAADHLQKPNDLVRAAVGWNGGFGDPVAIAWAADRMGQPRRHRTTRCTTGVRSEPRTSGITRCTTSLERNHVHLGSRFPQRAINTTGDRTTRDTTGNPHNAPAYHTLHNEHGHAGAGTTGMQESRPIDKKACRSRRHGCRTDCASAAPHR
jgi:hypothetical protein